MDQIENTGGEAHLVNDLGVDHGGNRRVFGWFQNTGTPRRQRRYNLQRNLVDRPVPRRNQAANADRLTQQHIAIGQRFPLL